MIKYYGTDVKMICQTIELRGSDSYIKADEVSKYKQKEVFKVLLGKEKKR
jgi:hypothetical protein